MDLKLSCFFDVLVAGSGITGLSAAREAAASGCRTAILSETHLFSGSSFYPGTWGFGLVGPEDENDTEDMIATVNKVGCQMADPDLVRTFVSGINPAISHLESMGCHPKKAARSSEREYIPCFDHKHRNWNGLEADSLRHTFSKQLEGMNQKYHPNVNLGAAIAGDGLLTDHGVNHVKSVISHAQSILVDPMQLTGYELYLLLVSIHFHDVGNILGRDKHEEKIESIIGKMGDSLPLDTAEQGFVTAIATAHGGYVDGSKDTIHAMNIVDESYDSVQIRCKLLAAILRFADEISDDLGRAAPPEISIPAANQAYHEYSKALVPVSIEGDTIKFQFRVPYDLTQNKIGKNGKKVYLYDEILNRLAKCMRELEYCKKYACGMIRLTTLNVVIGFLKQGSSHQFQESVPLRLTLQGYPDETRSSISDYLDAGLPGTVNGLKFKDGKAVRAAMSLK